MSEKKPSEKIIENDIDGKETITSTGRIIKLRKPRILDIYDLMSAMGEDAAKPGCFIMASKTLYIASIDGAVFETPKSYAAVRAAIAKLGDDGFIALNAFMEEQDDNMSEREANEKIKK